MNVCFPQCFVSAGNYYQHSATLPKAADIQGGKHQLQWVTDSCRQSHSLCDKVLIVGWAGKEIQPLFPELCIFVFDRPGTRDVLFPLFWNGRGLPSAGLTALLLCFSGTGNGPGLVWGGAPLLKKDHSWPCFSKNAQFGSFIRNFPEQLSWTADQAPEPHFSFFTKGSSRMNSVLPQPCKRSRFFLINIRFSKFKKQVSELQFRSDFQLKNSYKNKDNAYPTAVQSLIQFWSINVLIKIHLPDLISTGWFHHSFDTWSNLH